MTTKLNVKSDKIKQRSKPQESNSKTTNTTSQCGGSDRTEIQLPVITKSKNKYQTNKAIQTMTVMEDVS